MEIKQSTKPIFLIGSQEFLTMTEAEEYKRVLMEQLSYTYYSVLYSPDLTEGRGHYKRVNIACKKGYTRNALIHYLVTTFGNPVVKVMGVSAMDNWTYSEGQVFSTIEDLDAFLNEGVQVGLGDYRKTEVLQTIYIDEAGEPLEQQYHL